MKIIQSLWTKPLLTKQNGSNSRSHGGWLSDQDYLVSLSYSCLKLKQYYNEVELITDKKGKELLIDILGLPYSSSYVCLDQFNSLPPLLWVVPKVFSYSVAKGHFLHVDNDVFIWESFPPHVEVAELAVQNMEINFSFYYDALDYVKNFRHLPKYIANFYTRQVDFVTSVNAGIIGGSDNDFFQEYFAGVLKFIDKNKSLLNDSEVGKLTVIIDQFLFYGLALEKQKKITPLIETVSSDYSEVLAFYKVPILSKFIHAVGNAKKDPLVSELINHYLRREFPEVYNTIKKLFKDNIYHLWAGGISRIPNSAKEPKSNRQRESSGMRSLQNVIAKIKNNKLRTKGIIEEVANLEQIVSDFSNDNNYIGADDMWFKRFCEAQNILTTCSLEELLNKEFVLAENHKVIELSFPLENFPNSEDALKNPGQEQYVYLMRFNKEKKFEITLLSDLKILLYYFSERPKTGIDIIEILKENYGTELSDNKINEMVFTFISQSLLYDNSLSPA